MPDVLDAPAPKAPLHLVDASLYVFRAWHSMPDEFHDADGWPTNAVHGFARFVLELLEQEQLLTAGCVCFALLQSAQALGFGAQWLTGWAAYDAHIGQALGLQPNEKVAGFIHIGTPRLEVPERERPDAHALLEDWHAHA